MRKNLIPVKTTSRAMSSPIIPLSDLYKNRQDDCPPPLYYEDRPQERSPLSPVIETTSLETVEISSEMEEIPVNRYDPMEKENHDPNEISSTTSEISPSDLEEMIERDESEVEIVEDSSVNVNNENNIPSNLDEIVDNLIEENVDLGEEYDPGEYVPPRDEFREDVSLKRKKVPIHEQCEAYKRCKTNEQRIMYVRDRCIDLLGGEISEGKAYLEEVVDDVINKERPSNEMNCIVFNKIFIEGEVNRRILNGLFLYLDNILNATIFDNRKVKRLRHKENYMLKAKLCGGDFRMSIKIWDQKMIGKLYKNYINVEWSEWKLERFIMDSYNDYFFESAIDFCNNNK